MTGQFSGSTGPAGCRKLSPFRGARAGRGMPSCCGCRLVGIAGRAEGFALKCGEPAAVRRSRLLPNVNRTHSDMRSIADDLVIQTLAETEIELRGHIVTLEHKD